MSRVPANLARVPDLMLMRSALARLNRTNVGLFNAEHQLSTGRRINTPSDDAVRAAAVSILDDRLERADQRQRNLDHASLALGVADDALGEASDLVLEAKSIASTQSSLGASSEERAHQAQVVDSLLESLFNVANRKSIAGYALGGSSALRQPVEMHMGGYRYVGEGDGLHTDSGLGDSVPITLGGSPLGELSARHKGNVDLDPALTGDTRIEDLRGARGLGVTLGQVEFSWDGGQRIGVDLTDASTAGDVADAIEASIRAHEGETGETILGSGGVSFSGGSFTFDLMPSPSGPPNPTLSFFDVGQGVTAMDLGLTTQSGMSLEPGDADTRDVDPVLTWRTPVGALDGLASSLGSIRVTNMGQTQLVDLSEAETLGDVRDAIEGTDLGLRVEINDDGTGLDVLNEVAGRADQAMSISEASPSASTAAALGLRTFTAQTRIADFNDGRGVQIATGATDPETGEPDPAGDVDFTISLGDGTEIPVNLRPQDVVTVRTVIDRINAQAADAGVGAARFQASVSPDTNGFRLRQTPASGGPITVSQENNSPAAGQLGLIDGQASAGGAIFTSSDRARVRVDNVFTHLIDLRDSLASDDDFGIGFASEGIESSIDRLAQTRALVGGFASRVESESRRQEDMNVLDRKTRSELRDLDYAEAAVRFSMLQTQLQASMQVIAASQSSTLLDFLG